MILERKLRIAGYCRISVDDELDRDNTSIENQKSIIKDNNHTFRLTVTKGRPYGYVLDTLPRPGCLWSCPERKFCRFPS